MLRVSLEDGTQSDPLKLKQFIQSPEYLETLGKNRKLLEFYERQNALISTFLGGPGVFGDKEDEQLRLRIAVYGSFAANLCLFCLQLTAAILSKSLALFATTADAFMDLASSFVLVGAAHIAAKQNYIKYPAGKSKYETAGIIVFATLMCTLSLEIVVTSIQGITAADHDLSFSFVSIICVGVALGTKLLLFLYCRLLTQFPTAKILAQDHRNDLLLNSTGILFGLLADYFAWWIDPFGAILIAILILWSWSMTGKEHIQQIVGISAEPDVLNHLIYLALTHDDRIVQIDTCKAYHSGNNYFVEVDIVLPPEMPLVEAHDIGESLQIRFENLPQVDRAFVHLDYEYHHKPEHKKDL